MARVRHRVGISGSIGSIFRALYEPDGIVGWWATTADGMAKIGHVLDLHFSDVVTLSFRVEELTEPTCVWLKCVSGPGPWQNSTLRFTLEQDADQVWLNLVHENSTASEADFLYFNTKWPSYLLSLRDFIETGTGRPYPNETKIHFGD